MRSARHRRPGARPAAAAAAAAVLVVAGGILWWRAADEPVAAPPCRLPVPPTAGPPSGAALGGGQVRVAEQGYTQEVAGAAGGRPGRISMGAVLENTGTQVAYRTRVTFAAVDADGGPAVHAGHRSWLVQEVPMVMPGRPVPVGVALPAEAAPSGAPAQVVRVTVTTAVTGWLPPGDASFGTVAVTLTPGGAARDGEGTGAFDYVTESTWCAELKPRGTSMVFRDRVGTLVGGDLIPDGSPEHCRPGVNRQRLATNPQAVPPTADLDRTEISEYCDVAPATGLIPGSVLPTGVPIN